MPPGPGKRAGGAISCQCPASSLSSRIRCQVFQFSARREARGSRPSMEAYRNPSSRAISEACAAVRVNRSALSRIAGEYPAGGLQSGLRYPGRPGVRAKPGGSIVPPPPRPGVSGRKRARGPVPCGIGTAPAPCGPLSPPPPPGFSPGQYSAAVRSLAPALWSFTGGFPVSHCAPLPLRF